MSELSDFIAARLSEDGARDRRRHLLRRYLLGVDRERREALAIAARWAGEPGNAAVGEDWLRRIARHWHRHPAYRAEWKP